MAALSLEEVETLIRKVSAGQKVTLLNGVSYERADFATLLQLRATLQQEAAATQPGGVFINVGLERGCT